MHSIEFLQSGARAGPTRAGRHDLDSHWSEALSGSCSHNDYRRLTVEAVKD